MALTHQKRRYRSPLLTTVDTGRGSTVSAPLLMCTFPAVQCTQDGPTDCSSDPLQCDCPTPGPDCGG
jgi:hypothetical protein